MPYRTTKLHIMTKITKVMQDEQMLGHASEANSLERGSYYTKFK